MLTNVTADDALYLARYFAPKWTEMRGCVVRADAVADDAFDEWWESTDGDRQRLEYVVNHVHLWDMLPGTDDTDYGELWDLGEVLQRAWRDGLSCAFPDREFEVTLTDDYGPTVSAVTVRSAASSRHEP